MPAAYKLPGKRAKRQTDAAIGNDRRCHRWFSPVVEKLAVAFPRKLAPELALHSGCSQRVCEIWISGKGSPGGPALAALIQSDIGDLVLLALTDGCQHAWAYNVRATHEISQLRKTQADTARRLEALERGLK